MVTATRLNGRITPHTIRVEVETYRILDALRMAMEKETGRRVSLAEVVKAVIHEAGMTIRRNGSEVASDHVPPL